MPTKSDPTATRRRLFFGITISLPILFLALCELGLRAAGIGGSYPLFVEAQGLPDYLHASPDVMRRYAPSIGALWPNRPLTSVMPRAFARSSIFLTNLWPICRSLFASPSGS